MFFVEVHESVLLLVELLLRIMPEAALPRCLRIARRAVASKSAESEVKILEILASCHRISGQQAFVKGPSPWR
jgi:hypothetical protein